MRILIDYIASDPDRVTGISVYTFCLAAALARHREHRIYLHTNWSIEKLPLPIREGMADILTCNNPRNETLSFLSRSARLPSVVKRVGADIVLSPHPVAPFLGRSAHVLVVHDLYRATHPKLHSAAQRLQWSLLFPLSLWATDAAICVSHATRNGLAERYPWASGKAFVTQEAAPLAPETPLVVREPPEDFALMVANIQPNKNVATWFKAILALRARGFSGRFVIVGEDPHGEIDRFLTQHPQAGLEWLRGVGSQELAALYRKARCYVNCSLTEGFCMPILEAQSFGVPVVCSDIDVLREVAGGGALFFPPQNWVTLADRLEFLFTNSASAAALSAAALTNAAKFSWERTAQETLTLFERVSQG